MYNQNHYIYSENFSKIILKFYSFQIGIELTEIDELVTKQRKLLHQLDDFKQHLHEIKNQLSIKEQQVENITLPPISKANQSKAKTTTSYVTPLDLNQLKEIVVHTSPELVPFSLIGLQKLWRGRVNLVINSFTHSSVRGMTIESLRFVDHININKPDRGLPNLKISVIFKEIDNLQFIISPTAYFPLVGEINLIRYLSRVGPTEFNYEISDGGDVNQTDLIFDTSSGLLSARTAKEKMNGARLFNTKLGKQQFFGVSSPNIVDLAVCTAIRHTKVTNELIPALKTWFQRVEKFFWC